MQGSPVPPDPLQRLQREFQAYVLGRDPAVLASVRATGRADAATRMDVYADGYAIRLVEALQSDYPGLAALAGPEDFETLARAYVAATPSGFRNLRWYGGALPGFVAQTPPWCGRAGLADMASFEWAMSLSFDAADAAPMRREDLAGLAPEDWPHMRLAVHPAVQVVTLRSNAPAAWSAQARGEPLPALVANGEPASWLLARRELQVRFRVMAPDEAAALMRVRAGEPFGQWCDAFAGDDGEAEEGRAAERAVQCLLQWLADGALAGFSVSDV